MFETIISVTGALTGAHDLYKTVSGIIRGSQLEQQINELKAQFIDLKLKGVDNVSTKADYLLKELIFKILH